MSTSLVGRVAVIVGSLAVATSAEAQVPRASVAQTDSAVTGWNVAGREYRLDPAKLRSATSYAQSYESFSSARASLMNAEVELQIAPQLSLGSYASGSAATQGGKLASSLDLFWEAAGAPVSSATSDGYTSEPWGALASGWRGRWLNESGATTSFRGTESAALQVRVRRAVAMRPVIGVMVSTFSTEETPGAAASYNISRTELNPFFFVGLTGRFDSSTGTGHPVVALR